jgi:RimJ/RimL family protein N-acetyltransferase
MDTWSDLSWRTKLTDGAPVLFRPIRPDDRQRLARVFEQLSPKSRYRRFLSPLSALSDQQLNWFADVDFVDHVAWGAELTAESDRPLVAVGRWIRSSTDPELAEIALTVVDAYQRRGLGTALLAVLAESAQLLHVRVFEGSVLAENLPMRALLRTVGATSTGFAGSAINHRLLIPTLIDSLHTACGLCGTAVKMKAKNNRVA